jgi:hypothetical protein
MRSYISRRKQQGAITVFISIIMLVMLTVLVIGSYAISSTTMRSVGNLQVREEAIAAANLVIERQLSGNFTAAPIALVDEQVNVAADPNSPTDYYVNLLAPACVRATRVITTVASSVSLPGMTFGSGWDTVWELDATARNDATGAEARVVQGVRVLMTDAEKAARCPDV